MNNLESADPILRKYLIDRFEPNNSVLNLLSDHFTGSMSKGLFLPDEAVPNPVILKNKYDFLTEFNEWIFVKEIKLTHFTASVVNNNYLNHNVRVYLGSFNANMRCDEGIKSLIDHFRIMIDLNANKIYFINHNFIVYDGPTSL